MTPNDTKMIPTAFEAYTAESKDLSNTTFTAIHATKYKERRSDTFTNMATSADSPDAIRQYYASSGTNSGHTAPGLSVVGVKNSSIKNLEFQGWYMQWPSIVAQAVLEANYGMKFGDFGLSFGGRYFKQADKGAGDIIKPQTGASFTLSTGNSARLKGDDDNKIDTHMYAVRAVGSYKAAKLLLAYSHTDKGGDLLAPWRGFPTEGYTRSMTQTDWNANTTAYKAQLDYNLNSLVQGASALLSYSYYNRDEGKVPYQSMTDRAYVNGDTIQWNFDVMYKPAFVKNIEFNVRTMLQKNDPTSSTAGGNTASASTFSVDTSNKELRVEMNYIF